MQRSAPPSPRAVPAGPRRAGLVCGIATILGLGAAALPGPAQAQAAGTMQVLANVARAEPAWAGLRGAQAIARATGPAPGVPARRQLDLTFARIRWEPAVARVGTPDVATVTVQYLHN